MTCSLVVFFICVLSTLTMLAAGLRLTTVSRSRLRHHPLKSVSEYNCRIINYKDKSEKTIKISSNKLILDVAEQFMDIPAQCRGGICNTCVGKLVSGTVDQFSEQENILGEKAVAAGYVLTCVAKPTSNLEMYVGMELEYIKDPEVW